MKKFIKFIKNWSWFLFVLKRNEFHPSLNLDAEKAIEAMKEGSISDYNADLVRRRQLAHDLDNQWNEFIVKVKKFLDPKIL